MKTYELSCNDDSKAISVNISKKIVMSWSFEQRVEYRLRMQYDSDMWKIIDMNLSSYWGYVFNGIPMMHSLRNEQELKLDELPKFDYIKETDGLFQGLILSTSKK